MSVLARSIGGETYSFVRNVTAPGKNTAELECKALVEIKRNLSTAKPTGDCRTSATSEQGSPPQRLQQSY